MGKFAMGAAALAALTLTGWAASSAQFRGEVDPTGRWTLLTWDPKVVFEIPFDGFYDGEDWRVMGFVPAVLMHVDEPAS